MRTTFPAHHERIDANARTPDVGHCCVPLTMRLAAASASASWMAFANCGVVSMSTTPRTESTAAGADQSVSMLNPLLAVVDAESGIWVECVAMVMSRAVSTYALRRGCVSNSHGEAPGAWGACVVLDGLLVIVVPVVRRVIPQGLASHNSPGAGLGVGLTGLCWRCLVGGAAGSFPGPVAGSVHEDLVAGVDQPVEQ